MAIELQELRREVAELQARDAGNPRVHPNGFIQLDLDDVEDSWAASHKQGHSGGNRRLHIWNPPGILLPHQGTVNEIHDHVFDMFSTVVKGTLLQQRYQFLVGRSDDPTHQLYRTVYSKKADSRLEALGVYGHAEMWDRFSVSEGESYKQAASTFHDTDTPLGLVVTVMEKTEIVATQSHVLVPIDVEPDNSYDRANAMSKDSLWEAISRSLV